MVGGIAVSEEIFPGFKSSPCAHLAGSFSNRIVADLDLKSHGFELLALDPLSFAPNLAGPALLIPRNSDEAAAEIARHSKSDADKYPRFCTLAKNLALFLQTLYGMPLPDKANPGNFHPTEFLKMGWKFHRLGKKEMYEFLRVLPMSAADWLDEWFDNDLLKAALAASGMLGSFVGPRQQGTAFNLLHHQLGASNGLLRTAGFIRGGIGQLPTALAKAAQRFGAEIRSGAEVLTIATKSSAATGIVLQNGEEIRAAQIISSVDVKRTFLKLLESTYLDPHFLLQVRNIRARGTVGKINLALDALPRFKSGKQSRHGRPRRRHSYRSDLDYLERAADDAKYGRFSERPFLEITIPSIADPSVAPAGKHVMSVWMQSAPYQLRAGDWNQQGHLMGDAAVNLIEDYAPGFKNLVLHRQVLTPLDLEQQYGLTGGHLYHAEMALDQIFFMRPVPGWSRYHTPIENLYLCGSGVHPGGGVTGLPGYYAAREILKSRSRQK